MGFFDARRAAFAALAVLVAASAFGCSGSSVTDGATGQSADELNTNDEAAFDYFVGKGLTPFQAAGVVGNLDQESNVRPTAEQPGGPGRGIAQWSTGGRWDHDANDNAVAYAAKKGVSVWSLDLQLDFIWYELTTFGYGFSALKASTNVSAATIAFQQDFEGCGTCDETNRINYAKAVLAAYGAIPYGASYVSQSFPLATTTLKMRAGQVLPSFIELKNSGTKNWDSNTKIGTTSPRDRASAFTDPTWLSPSRPAGVTGTVAPGGTYKFQFDLHAPAKPGTYDEFFGVVEEGVAWFGDPGQGGPSDTNIEVKIVVSPNDGSDAGEETDDDGGVIQGEPQGSGTGDPSASAPSNGDATGDAQSGGCAISAPTNQSGKTEGFAIGVGFAIALLVRRRRSSVRLDGRIG